MASAAASSGNILSMTGSMTQFHDFHRRPVRRIASALIAAVRGRPRGAFDTPVRRRSIPLPAREPVPEPRPVTPTHRHRLLQAAEVHVLARLRPGLQPLDVLEV